MNDLLSLWPWLIPAAFAVGAILAAKKSLQSKCGYPPIGEGRDAWEEYYDKKGNQDNFFVLALFFVILALFTALAIWRWPDWWLLLGTV